jgi:GAF domain-containing protein
VDVQQALQRWPQFARDARRAGVASYLSAPLSIDERFAGSLNLYGEQPGSFGGLDEALVRLYTTAATDAIASARRYAQARAEADNLRRALDSRAVIDQAIGVLMAQRGIGPQQAFDELSRTSQNTNTKLRDVAGKVIDRARRRIT